MAKSEMVIEFDQRGLRIMERMAKALEESNQLIKARGSEITTVFADNQPYLIRGDEDGFLEVVPNAKMGVDGNSIRVGDMDLFFRWCGEPVTEYTKGQTAGSNCVLPKGHGGISHMDIDGILKALEDDGETPKGPAWIGEGASLSSDGKVIFYKGQHYVLDDR